MIEMHSQDDQLNLDKVIAITGASGGIGEATARLLGRTGVKLALGARRTEKLSAIAKDIVAAGGAVHTAELNVANRQSMDAFIAGTIQRYGKIDVLVCNAGVMMLNPLSDLRVGDWESMIDVNVKGVLYGLAAALPHMINQQSGHFVIVGSTTGHRVQPAGGVYGATKHAVRALAESIRLEGGNTIRSTLISPGAVATELYEKINNPELQELVEPMRKDFLNAEAVANAIIYAIQQPPEVDVSEIIVQPMSHKY